MIYFTFYDQFTGEIKGNGSGSITGAGELKMIEGNFSTATHYIALDKPTPYAKARPDLGVVANKDTIKANSADEAIISNIPSGCSMRHDDETHIITDGIVEFTADHPGTYTFDFFLFPYKPVTITVEAVSP